MSPAQDPSPSIGTDGSAPDGAATDGNVTDGNVTDGNATGHPHDFDVQKDLHRRIRNDPDYDDWEYGTEPLPHEAWLSRRQDQTSA